MPRSVRNFWVEVVIDGRKSIFKSGPRSAGGGFMARFYIRERGRILPLGMVVGSTLGDDRLQFESSLPSVLTTGR